MKIDDDPRIQTFLGSLDNHLEGGVPASSIVLLVGRAGTMKSSVAYNCVYHNAIQENKKTIYITLEQSRKSLLKHMRKLGFHSGGEAEIDNLVVIDLARLRKENQSAREEQRVDWSKSIVASVRNYQKMFGCDVLVLDSLAALYSLSDFQNPRADLFRLFESLRDLQVTCFLIMEQVKSNPDEGFGQYGVEDFLADGIIHLNLERTGNRVSLYISVPKMRMTDHPKSYFPLIFDETGFDIVMD